MTHPHTIAAAIEIASSWIRESPLPFHSGFIGGSVVHADPAQPYESASDIDCYLVVDGDPPEGKIGKITVGSVLLDVSWIAWAQLEAAESHAVLASLLHFGRVVRDDSAALTDLKRQIDARFTDKAMIALRLEDMRNRIRGGLTADSSHLHQPEQVMNWLFPATLATHIPLIAACAPLTVRKRFVAARAVVAPAAYESLLHLLGFADVNSAQAQFWLGDTATLFNAVAPLATTSQRFWASDIYTDARPIAIGGSQQLIDCGLHREALFWIIATRTRCLTVLNDAGADTGAFMPAFREMTRILGIQDSESRATRNEAVLDWIETYQGSS